jgi:hypothetical protein
MRLDLSNLREVFRRPYSQDTILIGSNEDLRKDLKNPNHAGFNLENRKTRRAEI